MDSNEHYTSNNSRDHLSQDQEMRFLTDYTSNDSTEKPSQRQVMETTKEVSRYEPGEIEFHRDLLDIAEEMDDEVTERNEDATYDQIYEIESEAFDQLDEVSSENRLPNYKQAEIIAEGGPIKFVGLEEERSESNYDSGAVGTNLAAIGIRDTEEPEKNTDLRTVEDWEKFLESGKESIARRAENVDLERVGKSFYSSARNRGVDI